MSLRWTRAKGPQYTWRKRDPQGEIDVTGVHIPVLREIYDPALDTLKRPGIAFEEQVA